MSNGRPIRVAQWGTGNVGVRSLLRVIEHPNLELVGLWVHSADKAGKDAGELAGTAPTGVIATNRLDDILAAKPECVLYMQQGTDFDDVCRLLESGANIVTTRDDFHHPPTMDPAIRARIEAACAKGGTSIHSTGSSPGFITEALPIVLTSISRRLDCLTIDEYADCSSRNSPEMLFQIMGFGRPMETLNSEGLRHHLRHTFQGTLRHTADALGIPLDEVDTSVDFVPTVEDVAIAAGIVPKGTMGAQRIVIAGRRGGKTVLQWRAHWYVTSRVSGADAWNFRESGWSVLVEGDTPLKVDITYPVSAEDYPLFTPNLTAHRPINAIRAVVEAAPGIRTTADLPQIVADLS
jgi:4-hydroxy-tetrahydrodipicolinate reductase